MGEMFAALLTLIDGRLVFSVALDVPGEPFVKLFVGIEQRGHDEVQQGPQLGKTGTTQLITAYIHTHSSEHTHTQTHLGHRVLDGRSSQQESVSTLKLQKDLPPNTRRRKTREPHTTSYTPIDKLMQQSTPMALF